MTLTTYPDFQPQAHPLINAWYANTGPRQYIINARGNTVYTVSQFVTGEQAHKRRSVLHESTYGEAKNLAEQWETEARR